MKYDENTDMGDCTLSVLVCNYLGISHQAFIEVVIGASSVLPCIEGKSGYHTTMSGNTVVAHPGAYGWPTVYVCSTLCGVVTTGWVAQHLGWVRQDKTHGVMSYALSKTRKYIHGWRVELVVLGANDYRRSTYLVTAPDGWKFHSNVKTHREAVRQAILRRRAQIKADAQLRIKNKELVGTLIGVEVTVDDALAGGACMPGIRAYCGKHRINIKKAYAAVELPELFTNVYVRRAAVSASRCV